MKFAVMGTGGVGGYFGGKLAKAGANVWFVARGSHLDAMCAQGLRITSFEGDWIVPSNRITGSLHDIGAVDVILFCVKSYHTESAASEITPLLSDETVIISLQNGVDNEEKIQRIIPRGVVFGGVSYIYSTITAPGIITHAVGPTRIVFGELKKQSDAVTRRAHEIVDILTGARIDVTLSEDIQSEIWKKFVFIAAVGGMTTLTRATLGEILAAPASRDMLRDAMRETELIAMAKHINLPPHFTEYIFDVLKKYDTSSRSSMYHDLTNNKPIEIEAFSGTVVRYGRALNIATPVHSAIYAGLLPHHLKHLKET